MVSVGGGFSSQMNGSLLTTHKTLVTPKNSLDARIQPLAQVVQGRKMQGCIGSLPPQQPSYSSQQQWTANGKRLIET